MLRINKFKQIEGIMSSSLDKQMNKRKEKKDKKLKESLKDDKLKIKMQEVYK